MTEPPTLIDDLYRALVSSSHLHAMGWGAAGGLTSGLAITGQTRRAVLRQITMGALIAGGSGAGAAALLSSWLGLPALAVGAGSGASYLIGVFGPALFEVVISRIRAGRLPNG